MTDFVKKPRKHAPPLAYRLSPRWSIFRATGRRPGWLYKLKLTYGLLGLFIITLVATTRFTAADDAEIDNLPPQSWYWQWTRPEAGEISGSTAEGQADSGDLTRGGRGRGHLSQDKNEGVAQWGTTRKTESIRKVIGEGAEGYLLWGLVSSTIGLFGGVFWALMIAWPVRPRIPTPTAPSAISRAVNWAGTSVLELVDCIPKFMLVFVIYAFTQIHIGYFSIGMGIFFIFGMANLVLESTRAFFSSEQYLYAMELGLRPGHILRVHLLRRRILPFALVQLPFMISSFILWEATMSYLDFGDPAFSSWGRMIKTGALNELAPWEFLIPMTMTLLAVSSLYILGDAVRERMETA